jgi:GTP cyclohydrolase FolE2
MNQRDPHLPIDLAATPADVPDVQGRRDERHIAIDQVGIRGIRHPLQVRSATGAQHTVGTFAMTVRLREDVKGTHMSRFVELLEAERAAQTPLDTAELRALLARMLAKLGVAEGRIEVAFPYFVEKTAPVSTTSSRLQSAKHRASSTASSSASTKSLSPNARTTIRSSLRTWCAISPPLSIAMRASAATHSKRRTSSRFTITLPTR